MPYLRINNYSGLGKLGISLRAIDTIATHAAKEIQGVDVARPSEKESGKKGFSRLFTMPSGVHTTASSLGKAIVHIDVELPLGAPVAETCLEIQKHVAESIRLYADALPLEIKIRVLKVG